MDRRFALAELVRVAGREVGAARAAELVAQAALALDDEELPADQPSHQLFAEQLWRGVADCSPSAFLVRPEKSWGQLAHALSYTLKNAPAAVQSVQLTADELRQLRRCRTKLREWTHVQSWNGRFRHVACSRKQALLGGAISLEDEFSGCAFPFHRGLSLTALYPLEELAELREEWDAGPELIVSMLVHEETHLVCAHQPGTSHTHLRESRLASAAFELAAQVCEMVAIVVQLDLDPAGIADYTGGIERLRPVMSLVRLMPRPLDLGQLTETAVLLGVAAARGEHELRAEAERLIDRRDPWRALKRALA